MCAIADISRRTDAGDTCRNLASRQSTQSAALTSASNLLASKGKLRRNASSRIRSCRAVAFFAVTSRMYRSTASVTVLSKTALPLLFASDASCSTAHSSVALFVAKRFDVRTPSRSTCHQLSGNTPRAPPKSGGISAGLWYEKQGETQKNREKYCLKIQTRGNKKALKL